MPWARAAASTPLPAAKLTCSAVSTAERRCLQHYTTTCEKQVHNKALRAQTTVSRSSDSLVDTRGSEVPCSTHMPVGGVQESDSQY